MGRLIYTLNVSLDGYVETLDHRLDWGIIDDELHTWFNERARELSASIYGRRMYELMSAYWPTAASDPDASEPEREFSRIWTATPRIVFSRTLEQVGPGARLERGEVRPAWQRIRAEVDGDIDLGGATLAASFLREDLVDEIWMVVHPVVLGAGTPFLPPLDEPLSLRLIETRRFATGVVAMGYERA